jgi:hypothetical protein
MDERIALILQETSAKIMKELLECDTSDCELLLRQLSVVEKAIQHFTLNTRDLLSTLSMHTLSYSKMNNFRKAMNSPGSRKIVFSDLSGNTVFSDASV